MVLCIVPQEGEEPRRTPMPHYSWTDQEATLVQTASFSSVPRGEKQTRNKTKKKAKTSAGEYFSDGPVKQSPRTCCALPRSARGYTSRLSRGRRPSFTFYFIVQKKKKVVSLAAGGEVEERHDTRSISSILLFLLLPCQLATPVSLLSAPSLRNNLLLPFCFCFFISLYFFSPAVVQTRHCFLMLKLLLVLCSGLSALSFLPSR